jgi:hypothetical protein
MKRIAMGKGKRKIQGGVCILTLALLLGGCSARPSGFAPGIGSKYVYTYTMSASTETAGPASSKKEMLFQDDSLLIQFKFDEAAVRFQMQNISYSNMRIEWNKAALSINGEYFAVRHKDNLYSDTSAAASVSSLIPPFGYVQDIAIPRKNVFYDGEKWTEKDLLPTTDGGSPAMQKKILKNVGKAVTLLLPIQIGKVQKSYEFEFQVASATKIPWENYIPVKRVPAPPNPPKRHTLEGIAAAVIVVGVLGFSTYMLTAKKNPVSE